MDTLQFLIISICIFKSDATTNFITINSRHSNVTDYSFVPVKTTNLDVLIKSSHGAKILLSETASSVAPFFEITLSGKPSEPSFIARDDHENIKSEDLKVVALSEDVFNTINLTWKKGIVVSSGPNLVVSFNDSFINIVNFIGFAAGINDDAVFMVPLESCDVNNT